MRRSVSKYPILSGFVFLLPNKILKTLPHSLSFYRIYRRLSDVPRPRKCIPAGHYMCTPGVATHSVGN